MHQVIDVSSDGYLSMMNKDGSTRQDLLCPDKDQIVKLQDAIQNGNDILATVLGAMGIEQVISIKINE